jgi:tetratricopeptide (TPR) repeat protein
LLLIGGGGFLGVRSFLADSHLNKAIECVGRGRFLEAEVEFRKALRLRPFSRVDDFNRFGKAYLEAGELEKAEAKFKEAIDLRPKEIMAHHNLLHLYLKRGDSISAQRISLHIIEKIDPRDRVAYITLSKLAMESDKPKEALSYLEQALRIHPKDLEVLKNLQKVFVALGEYDKALSVYRYIVAEIGPDVPQDPDMMSGLGKVYLDKGKDSLAEELFKVALKEDPHHPEARLGLASIYLDRSLKEVARDELNRILEHKPRYADAHALLGRVFLSEGSFESAKAHLLKALDIEPHDPINHYWMGNVDYALGNMEGAIASYQRARTLGFESEELLYNVGMAYYELGRHRKAIRNWKRVLERGGEASILNYNLGNAFLHLSNWPEAEIRYKRALSEYHKRLNSIKLRGDTPQLENRLYLEIGRIYNNIGVVYEKLNMEDEALRSYTTALEYASWGRGEDRVAYRNINRIFEGKRLTTIEGAIHSKLPHKYLGS